MKEKIIKTLKSTPQINGVCRTIKKRWDLSNTMQMIIMRRVLKYNRTRFYKYSGAFNASKTKDTAYLTWLCHVIEKGMAMPEMRLGFGQDKVKELGSRLEQYAMAYGKENITYQSGVSVLKQYRIIHEQMGFIFSEDIFYVLNKYKDNMQTDARGGGWWNIHRVHFTRIRMLSFQCLLRADIQ